MTTRVLLAFCFSSLVLIIQVQAVVRRDVSTAPTQLLDAFHENVDQFRRCIDQSLAKAVSEVNEKQLQPLFTVIGDNLGRVSKAFEDLTAPRSTEGPPTE